MHKHLGSTARVGSLLVFALGVITACAKDNKPLAENIGTTSQSLSSVQLQGGSLPAKTLALTFDDGPGPYASQIADYLLSEGIHTAFFTNGNRYRTSTDLNNENNISPTANAYTQLTQILADGDLVENHTVTHRDMVNEIQGQANGATQLFNELNETDQDIAGYVPSGFYLFRAPYGSYNSTTWSDLKGTTMNKYVGGVYWDMGGVSTNYPSQAADWACWQGQITCGSVDTALGCPSVGALAYGTGYLTTDQCGDAYLKEIESVGHGIILNHDPYFWAQGNTLDMIKYIVPKLKTAGYSFVRVDQVPDVRALLPACDVSCATCLGTPSTMCSSCNTGSYLNGAGNSGGSCVACSSCSASQYQVSACTSTANTACASCDASCATCSGAGATACTSCPANSYLSGGACHACSTCTAGSFESAACSATTDTTCTTCSAGTYSGANATTCISCSPGQYAANPGSTSCTDCGAGTSASAPGSTSCSTCDPGQSAGAGAATCSTCTAGTYAPADSATCATCADGTTSTANAATCTACLAGTYAKGGDSACTSCAPGSSASSPGATTCTTCAAGTFAADPGATTCASCAAGSYAAAGATTCTMCGSCDDGNSCTTDSCDSTLGCTHTAQAGCTSDAGTPTPAKDGGSVAPASDGGAPPVQQQDDGGSSSTPPSGSADAAVDNGAVSDSGGCNTSGSSSGSSGNERNGIVIGLGVLACIARRRRSRAAWRARVNEARSSRNPPNQHFLARFVNARVRARDESICDDDSRRTIFPTCIRAARRTFSFT